MSRYLLLAWVAVGLAVGVILHLGGRPDAAGWAWAGAALPVAARVALRLVRSLLGGRLGVDAVALAAILGAVALGENAAASVIRGVGRRGPKKTRKESRPATATNAAFARKPIPATMPATPPVASFAS